ncbi:MAG: VWA domain-containing protein [Flavobacteriales bacterium]|nr:VWA domain-containing protein [Flavobacteriales bacterium]MCB9448782.1 VWA domain-containing protein [Flavobacteriales bacterium]
MFRFEHIEFLHALWLIPLVLVIAGIAASRSKKALRRYADESVLGAITSGVSGSRPWFKTILFCVALALLAVGLANPQLGSKLQEVKRKGIDLVVAIDVSNSMKAEDIKPSRLERTRQIISRLVDNLHGDRIGIVVFGGSAYMQLPITTDYAAAKMYLGNINTDIIPTQGTAIGEAIRTSMKAFDESGAKSKVILVITDGENHEDDAITAAKEAAAAGIIVHTMGMGSPKGGPIPIYQNGSKAGFQKDREGNTIVTKLDPAMLKEIADAGDGAYFPTSHSQTAVQALRKQLDKMDKTDMDSKVFSDYEDHFHYFIAAALLLLTLESLIPERKGKWAQKLKI